MRCILCGAPAAGLQCAKCRERESNAADPGDIARRRAAASNAAAPQPAPAAARDAAALVLHLPEPPTLNVMLDMAKQRRRTRKGALPVVYAAKKDEYGTECAAMTRAEGIYPPAEPWDAWEVVDVELRVWSEYDPIEALASLKWPIDWLVHAGFVTNDSPRELLNVVLPRQVVDRGNRGLTLTIRKVNEERRAA